MSAEASLPLLRLGKISKNFPPLLPMDFWSSHQYFFEFMGRGQSEAVLLSPLLCPGLLLSCLSLWLHLYPIKLLSILEIKETKIPSHKKLRWTEKTFLQLLGGGKRGIKMDVWHRNTNSRTQKSRPYHSSNVLWPHCPQNIPPVFLPWYKSLLFPWLFSYPSF